MHAGNIVYICSSKSSTNVTKETWCTYWDKLDNALPGFVLILSNSWIFFSSSCDLFLCEYHERKTIISKMKHKIWSWIIKNIPKYTCTLFLPHVPVQSFPFSALLFPDLLVDSLQYQVLSPVYALGLACPCY